MIVNKYALRINKEKIKTQSLVNFLGVQSDNKLKFNSFFSKRLEINGITRIPKILRPKIKTSPFKQLCLFKFQLPFFSMELCYK